MILSKAAVNASVEVLVGFQTARRWEKQHMCSVDLVADWRDECFPLCHHFFTLRADLWQTPSHSWGEALAVRAQADPPWRAGCEARTLLTVSQGGVHRRAPSPRAATPPRLALSGALVLNAGYEHIQQPAALWTACTQPCCMEPRDGPPGMKQL